MKMETPKMDVVRFEEADVLAASNDRIALTGFNNGNYGDATVDGKSVANFVSTLEVTHAEVDVFFQYNGNAAVNGKQLTSHEEDNSLKDGVYDYDSASHTWVWYQ